MHCVYPLQTGEADLNNTQTLVNNLRVNTSHVSYEVNLANGLQISILFYYEDQQKLINILLGEMFSCLMLNQL